TLAWVYSYGVVWIPLIYINFLLTLAFGFAIGMLIVRAAKNGCVRSSGVPALIGLVSGLLGLYVAWGVDFRARVDWPADSSIFEAFHPLSLFGYVQHLYDNGAWGFGKGGGNVTGIPLAIVWLFEAAVIVGLATWVPWSEMNDASFCESCGWWTK